MEERVLEDVSALSGPIDAAYGWEMAGNAWCSRDLLFACVLPSGVLHSLLWAGDLSIESLDWVSVAQGRSGAGSYGWRVAPDQGFG